MERTGGLRGSIFGLPASTTDSNRLYSILLDARASSVSENMYDIAEKLLASEKNNAKTVLEHLWSLKKNMNEESDTCTVDLIIDFYQEKMDILRTKEEKIRKVSRDSRGLLEEKRKRDSEIANIKQEMRDCSAEIDRLTRKHDQLKVKEQELSLIETQVQKELQTNANEVVNGLYEIILARQGGFGDESIGEVGHDESRGAVIPDEIDEDDALVDDETKHDAQGALGPAPVPRGEPEAVPLAAPTPPIHEADEHDVPVAPDDTAVIQRVVLAEAQSAPPFPKSVVKTTRGRVIGEYFYDPKIYKNKRHYVLNSDFFSTNVRRAVDQLIAGFDKGIYAETHQMIQDPAKRIAENPSLHFEVSTNEILNEKTLAQMQDDMRARRFGEVAKVCGRLRAKIVALGANYRILLKEQMDRYGES